MENRYFSVGSNWIWIILSGWVFWLLVSIIYWRVKNKDNVLQRLIRTILATSWVEFSLALPIDLAARTRESCYCAIGSYITLLITLPLLIWSIGPGLYFFYLRERELSLGEPGRARAILRQKSRRYARHSPRKVESYVSSARTISLLLIALAFVGMQLGIFNYQRGILFSQTRDLVLVKELKEEFNDNATLQSKIKDAPQGQGQYYKSYEFEKPSFGKIEIRQASENVVTFTAKVGRKEEAWESRPFSLNDDDIETRLNHALSALPIANDNLPTGSKLIERVRDAIYSKRVKLPSVDFGDFGTESAVWLVTLICVSALVALRNVVRRIFWSADMGIGEAWLVLDAGAIGEKLVAGIWISAIGLSGWLATLGLILSVMDVFQGATPRRGVGLAGATFGICAVLMILSSWAGAATVADILRLRQQRRLFDAEAAV
jgi:hypothetical protein